MNDSDKFTRIQATMQKQLGAISDAIAKIVSKLESGKAQNYGALKDDLAIQYEKARRVIDTWVRSNLPAEYADSIKEQIAKLKNSVVKLAKLPTLAEATNANTLRKVLDDTLVAFGEGLANGEKTLIRLINLTQQTVRSEAEVNEAIAKGFEEGGSAQVAKKKLRDELLSKARDGKYIDVVDKNGDVRSYDLRSYTDTVVRTKLSDASFQAVLDTAQSVNQDLVQISSHNTKTELCAEYEGKVFSLSGNDPDFPMLDRYPPFHPNCMHTATIVLREALEIDGTLDRYIAFSNDELEQHPTRTGFVPVSERDMN